MKKLIIAITTLLIQFTFISQSIAFFGWNEKESKPVAVIVNSELYPQIKDSIDRYLDDLKNEDYQVIFSLWDYKVHPDVDELKSLLKDYHETKNLQGAVLIGEIPYVLGEFHGDKGPIETYLMDLHNTNFIKTNDGIITDFEGPLNFDIWVSRISSKTTVLFFEKESEADLINRYFEKNHLYRTCQSPVPDLKLGFFANLDLIDLFPYYFSTAMQYTDSINNNYDYLSLTGNSDEYLDFIKKHLAQYLVLRSHSVKMNHGFKGNDYLWGLELENAVIKQPFAILEACSASDFSNSESVAKAYLFGKNSDVLVIAGLTVPGNILSHPSIHSNGETFGSNYLNFLQGYNGAERMLSLFFPHCQLLAFLGFKKILNDFNDASLVYSMASEIIPVLVNYLSNTFGLLDWGIIGYTLLGDPTLKPYIDMDWCPEYQESTEL